MSELVSSSVCSKPIAADDPAHVQLAPSVGIPTAVHGADITVQPAPVTSDVPSLGVHDVKVTESVNGADNTVQLAPVTSDVPSLGVHDVKVTESVNGADNTVQLAPVTSDVPSLGVHDVKVTESVNGADITVQPAPVTSDVPSLGVHDVKSTEAVNVADITVQSSPVTSDVPLLGVHDVKGTKAIQPKPLVPVNPVNVPLPAPMALWPALPAVPVVPVAVVENVLVPLPHHGNLGMNRFGPPYACVSGQCKLTHFTFLEGFKKHVHQLHGKKNPVVCRCFNRFSSEGDRYEHQSRHNCY